jgi:hypothetical protein
MTAIVSGRTNDALEALNRAHAQIVAHRETIQQLDGVLRAATHLPPDPQPSHATRTIGNLPATSTSPPPHSGVGNEPVHYDFVGTTLGTASTRQETFTMRGLSIC